MHVLPIMSLNSSFMAIEILQRERDNDSETLLLTKYPRGLSTLLSDSVRLPRPETAELFQPAYPS